MFSTEAGQEVLAIVKGGKSNGQIIYVKTDYSRESIIKHSPCQKVNIGEDDDGKFEQVPDPAVRVLGIFGPSGSGKSTYASNYIRSYLKLNPKSRFYVFSGLSEDAVIDKLKPHRIMVDQTIISDPIELEEIEKDSIILFDDCCNFTDRKIEKALNIIQGQILEMGRHKNLRIVVTSHLVNGNDRNATRVLQNEVQSFTFFPRAGSSYQIKYNLKAYFGLSATQINQIFAIDSRWITIIKQYPQVLISEKECIFVEKLGKEKK